MSRAQTVTPARTATRTGPGGRRGGAQAPSLMPDA